MLSPISIAVGQDESNTIDFSNFDKDVLSNLVLNEINKVRDSLHLAPLNRDSILDLAAENHNFYIREKKHLLHTQPNPNFANVDNRVLYYKGTHSKLSEIVDLVYVDKPTQIYKEDEYIKVKSYPQAAYFFVKNSLNTYSNYQLLSNPDFSNIGISVLPDQAKKIIYITKVIGSQPFNFPPYVYLKENKKEFFHSKKENIETQYGLQNFDEKLCYKCINALNKIPDTIPNQIVIENGKVFYHFGDLDLFSKIFSEDKFSFTVDIITKNQYRCNTYNVVHRSNIHDGILLKPVDYKTLLKKNEKSNQNILYAPIGQLPPDIDTNDFAGNLLIIKEKTLCNYSFNTPPVNSTLNLITTNLFLDTLNQANIINKKSIKTSIPFSRNKLVFTEDDLKSIYDSLQLSKYNIKDILVIGYSSVEGVSEKNQATALQKAESIANAIKALQKDSTIQDSVKITTKGLENWDQFYRDIRNTRFAYLGDLSEAEIKERLKSDTLLRAIETLISSHRKATLYLNVIEKIDLMNGKNELLNYYSNAISNNDLKNASIFQSAIFAAINNNQLPLSKLDSISLPRTKLFAQLINNEIIFRYSNGGKENYISKLEETSRLDPENFYIKYNTYDLILRNWKNDFSFIETPENFIKIIKSLYNTGIDKKVVTRLYINYHIIVAKHYQQLNKQKYREEAVGIVKKYYRSIPLNNEDILALANFYTAHNRAEWALELLFPYLHKGDYSEDMLFYFLSLALANREDFNKKEFHNFITVAKETNKVRFCELFGKDKIYFSLFQDEILKKEFCSACK